MARNTHPHKIDASAQKPCLLCGRPLILGPSVEQHHVVPKHLGGRNTVALHSVCHRMIHKVFSDQELAAMADDFAIMLNHPEIEKFVKWVRKKPNDFVDRPRTKGRTPYHKTHR